MLKLNNDLIRDLLLCFEEIGYDENFIVESNLDKYPMNSFELDEILYHINQMDKSGLIEISLYADGITAISDLTPYGHNFLANIRSDTVWNKTKDVLNVVGSKSLDTVVQVSSNVITQIIKSTFGLP